MWKYLLLLLFLDGFNLSSSDYFANNPIIEVEIPEVSVFDLDDNGENMVDSIRNAYNKDGVITHQWVYYRDGRKYIFYDNLDIVDIKLRTKYIQYRNGHDIQDWETFKRMAESMITTTGNLNEVIDNMADMLYFNSYLNKVGEGDLALLTYTDYNRRIKNESADKRSFRDILLVLALLSTTILLIKYIVDVFKAHKLNENDTKLDDTS